ncbi:MAG: biotin--[acetyl-CoA-carboxylase] ligase [Elusimicrobiota bacterium]
MKIIGKKIIRFTKTTSTQDYAKKIAKKSQSCTIIIAEKQTKGRGRFENLWNSLKGGLYFSVILKPKIEAKEIPVLTYKMALAIVATLKRIVAKNYSVLVKPPNDVIVKCEAWNKKIAGILTESSINNNKVEWIIIGVGININNKIPKNLKNIAISLKEIISPSISNMKQMFYLQTDDEITKKNLNIDKIFNEIIRKFVKEIKA